MRTLYLAATTCLLLGPSFQSGAEGQVADSTRFDRAAMEWVELLRDQDFDSAAKRVDPAVAAQLGADRLSGIWAGVLGQLGALQSLGPGSVFTAQGYHVVDLPGTFANGSVTVRVTLNSDLLVSGLFFRPPSDAPTGREVTVPGVAFGLGQPCRSADHEAGLSSFSLPGQPARPTVEEKSGLWHVGSEGPAEREGLWGIF